MPARKRPTTERDLPTALHEAAHIVVGVALGLRVRGARVLPPGHPTTAGYVDFDECARGKDTLAQAITSAAGVAWERRTDPTGAKRGAMYDERDLKCYVGSKSNREAAIVCASAILATRGAALKCVARALVERDLSGEDITTIARGGRVR